METKENILIDTPGKCKICGCDQYNPCFNPEYGTCWWMDDEETLCSHCAIEEIANSKATEHPYDDDYHPKNISNIFFEPGEI